MGVGLRRSLLRAAVVSAGLLSAAGAAAQAPAVRVDIAAQPLGQALAAFTQATGLSLVYGGALPQVQAPAVQGEMPAVEALDRLLAGSGLAWRRTGPNSVTLEPRPRSDGEAVRLPAVMIGGDVRPESAWGPVDGFAASRSASGTKTDTPLIETPQTIAVVTRDQMDAQAAHNVPEALHYTAGVQVDRNGADRRADYIFSRGFAVDQYLDGTRLQQGVWAVPQVDPFTLERLEVLKGPSSVLYGQAAPGGVANYVTRRPQAEAGGEVQVQLGNRNRRQAAFDVTGPLVPGGALSYRLTGLVRDTDVQVDHFKEERRLIAPAIAWRPDGDTELILRGEYLHDPDSGAYYKLPAQGTVLDNPNGRIPTRFDVGDPGFSRHERRQAGLSYNFSHRLDENLTVRANGRYAWLKGDYDVIVFQRLQPDLKTMNRQSYRAAETMRAWNADTQLEWRFETGAVRHTLLAGFDYQGQSTDRQDSFGTAPTLDLTAPVYGQPIGDPALFLDQHQTRHQYGAYLQNQMAIGDLRLTFGGRQDWARTRTRDRLSGDVTRQSDDAFSGRLGAVYLFDNGIAPFAGYSESFQPVAGTDFAGMPFEPTTGRQFEVGVRYQPPGTSALFSVSAFHLTQRNVLTADTDPAHLAVDPFAQVQTGEVRSRGIEFEGKMSFGRLNLTAAYAFVDAEVTRSNDGLVGRAPVYQPRHNASIWADYRFAHGLEGLRLGAGVRYFGETYGAADNSFKVPSFVVVDALVGYDLGVLTPSLAGFDLALNARNLFDKTYVAGCQNINTCYYGDRRTVMATLRYAW